MTSEMETALPIKALSARANAVLRKSPLLDPSDMRSEDTLKERIKWWGECAIRREQRCGIVTTEEIWRWANS